MILILRSLEGKKRMKDGVREERMLGGKQEQNHMQEMKEDNRGNGKK